MNETLDSAQVSLSLNQQLGDDGAGDELGDLIGDAAAADPADVAVAHADRADIRRALTMLGPREQLILERRFGFTGPPETLNEVADELGLTRERIRQLEQQALGRLANALTGSRLEAVS